MKPDPSQRCALCVHEAEYGGSFFTTLPAIVSCDAAGSLDSDIARTTGYLLRLAASGGHPCPFFIARPAHPDAYRAHDAYQAVPIERLGALTGEELHE